GRHDAMDMRMADERLSPRVQDAEESDPGAEVRRIGSDLEERRRAGAEQEGIEVRRIASAQRTERVRQREDDMVCTARPVTRVPARRASDRAPVLGTLDSVGCDTNCTRWRYVPTQDRRESVPGSQCHLI